MKPLQRATHWGFIRAIGRLEKLFTNGSFYTSYLFETWMNEMNMSDIDSHFRLSLVTGTSLGPTVLAPQEPSCKVCTTSHNRISSPDFEASPGGCNLGVSDVRKRGESDCNVLSSIKVSEKATSLGKEEGEIVGVQC